MGNEIIIQISTYLILFRYYLYQGVYFSKSTIAPFYLKQLKTSKNEMFIHM